MIRKNKILIFSQIYLTFLSILVNLLLKSRYETIDDLILSDFISGQYTGKSEKHLIFISDLIGMVINYISISLNLYAPLQILFIILIISLFFYYNNNSFFKISNLITISLVVIILNLRPSYTITALITSILIVSMMVNSNILISNLNKTFLLFLLIISISIRFEVVYLCLLYTVSFFIFNFIKNKKLNLKIYLYILGGFFFASIFNIFFEKFYVNNDWEKFRFWNQMRHQIHNRISQFKLDQILYPGGWTPHEHNLFVDWAYGDPRIFNPDWLKIAFDFTKNYRGFSSISNLDFNYFRFNIERYNIVSKWLILIMILISFSLFIFYHFNKKFFILYALVFWLPTIIFVLYSSFFLLLPDRIILPLILVNLILLLGYNNFNFKFKIIKSTLLLVINFILILTILRLNSENNYLLNRNDSILNDLKKFDSNAIYFIPGCENPYLSENPFGLKNEIRPIKILNVGCWDTFSPHWYQKKFNFNLLNLSAYDDLFENNVYWLSKSIPDTSLNIELLLKENGRQNINRSKIKSISGEYEIYKFTQN